MLNQVQHDGKRIAPPPPPTYQAPMARIVMKFGGTSMAGIERIRHVANLVKREAQAGNQVAVVVSAMAGETDRLVQFCREAASLYDPREYDVVVASGEQVTSGLLAITLQGMGQNARSYMGWQLPIRASGHASALIDDIGRNWDLRYGTADHHRHRL
jgi:aspartate kinase